MRDSEETGGRGVTAATAVANGRTDRRVVVAGALGAIAILALLVRITSIAEPLGVDQCFWASSAKAVARGQVLYVDVWDHKPPGTTLMYLAAFALFGWTPASIAWADILASAATAILLFIVVRRLGDARMGALAAALYTTLTMPAFLFRHDGIGQRAVAETFIGVLIALAAWRAVAWTQRRRPLDAALLGVCTGAAVMFKPNAGIYFIALLGWLAVYGRTSWRAIVRACLLAALGALAVPLLTLAWLWSRGALPQAWVALVEFNRMYVSQGLTLGGYALNFSKEVFLRMKTEPLWLAGGLGVVAAAWDLLRSRRLDPACALSIAWGAGAAVVIMTNGARLFNTYFIQALAPLSVLAAWLFAGAARRSLLARVSAAAAIVLMILVLVQRHYVTKVYEPAREGLKALTGQMSHEEYLDEFGGYGNNQGYSARANEELAAYIRAHTRREDSIYLFGINGAGIYFAADRPTAHRFLRVNFYVLGDFPDPRFHLDSVARELAAARPAYLIFEQLHSPAVLSDATATLRDRAPIVELLRSYRFDTQIEDFALYRRVN